MQDGNPAGTGGDPKPVELKPEEIKALQEKADKVAEFESKLQEAIKERDKAKGKLRELDDAEAFKKGESERLLLEKKTELEKLQGELAEAKTYKEKFEAIETQTRTELLAKLDDKHKAIANDLPIDKLKSYVELNTTSHDYNKNRTGGLSFQTDGKKWEDFTPKELQEIEKVNPELLKKLFETRK